MIRSVTFKKDFRCFKKDDKFDLRPGVNVLAGDQGTGKSTLIELIRSSLEKRKFNDSDSSYRAKNIEVHNKIPDLVDVDMDKDTACLAYDFERESARDMSALHFDMIGEQLAAMNSSHGQGNNISMNRMLTKLNASKDKLDVVLLDEPDAAMSPRSCYALLLILKNVADKWKKQVIVSAHNPIIIRGYHPLMVKGSQILWKDVLSLEDKKWMDAEHFMFGQLLDREISEKAKEKKEKKGP